MRIAAHIVLSKDPAQNYLFTFLSLLSEKHPDYTFLFFTNEEFEGSQPIPENAEIHYLHPRYRKSVWLAYWYRFKLPGLLKSGKADIFISETGMISEPLNISQFLFLNAPIPVTDPGNRYTQYPHTHRRNCILNAQRAKTVFTTSAAMPIYFANLQNKTALQICLPGLPAEYGLGEWEEIQKTRQQLTNEEDYFLFVVSETTKANLFTLLKAFSLFKKWQRSSMKLVLLLNDVPEKGLIADFHLYKYRDDIVFTPFESHSLAAPIFAAAYLQIFLPVSFTNENYDLFGLQSGLPLIVSETEFLKAKLKQAAVYVSLSEQSISDMMILLYKDENLKNGLLQHAPAVLKPYNWLTGMEIIEARLTR